MDRLQNICKKYDVANLYLFGSYSTKNQTEDSDIDMLVSFLDKDELFDKYMGLKEELTSLYKREVDLVIETNFRNPFFQTEINETKRLIYEVFYGN